MAPNSLMGGSATLLGAAPKSPGVVLSTDASRVFFLVLESVKSGLWGSVHFIPKAGGDITGVGALVGWPQDFELGGDGYVYIAAYGTSGFAGDDRLGKIVRVKLPD